MESLKIMKKMVWGVGLAAICLTSNLSAFFGVFGQDGCCEDGPLACNAFGVQVKGGVTPSHFTHRSSLWLVNPSLLDPVIRTTSRPKFSDLFETPWQVGAELQWNASSHVQFFAEYVYEQTKGKHHNFDVVLGDVTTAYSRRHKDFATNSFYLGARYFFGNIFCDECMGSIAPFLGFKAGFKWQESGHIHLFANDGVTDVDLGSYKYHNNQAAVSTGLQLGLDWAINCNVGVLLTGEAVITQALRTRGIRSIEDPVLAGGITSFGFGDHGRIVSFPVTLGLRYTF